MKPRLRTGLLITALVATLAAVQWASELDNASTQGSTVVDPVAREHTVEGARAPTTQQANGELNLARLQRSRALEPVGDLFVPQDFRPPPPPPPKRSAPVPAVLPQPAPPPQAPPLPFHYIGKLVEEGSGASVFLALGDRNLVLKPGDVVDDKYRVEEVTEHAVVLTYLPLSLRQTIPIGTTQ